MLGKQSSLLLLLFTTLYHPLKRCNVPSLWHHGTRCKLVNKRNKTCQQQTDRFLISIWDWGQSTNPYHVSSHARNLHASSSFSSYRQRRGAHDACEKLETLNACPVSRNGPCLCCRSTRSASRLTCPTGLRSTTTKVPPSANTVARCCGGSPGRGSNVRVRLFMMSLLVAHN